MGFEGVGGEGSEELGGWGVVVDHLALPSQGAPAAQFPGEAGGAVGGMVANGAVEEVFFDEWKSGREEKWLGGWVTG